jgi:hypothetical protein
MKLVNTKTVAPWKTNLLVFYTRAATSFFLLVIAALTYWGISAPNLSSERGQPIVNPSHLKVLEDLRELERIAGENNNTRAVTKGHAASVKYVTSELEKLSESLDFWTQDITVLAQVDEEAPKVTLFPPGGAPITFEPRVQVETLMGSGSARLKKKSLVFVKRCGFSTEKKSFVAVIDDAIYDDCSPCDRMVEAIREGAKAAVFLFKPGNQQGYPFSLPPRQRACRDHKYDQFSRLIGLVSLSDAAAFSFLEILASNAEVKISMEIITAYRDIQSKNVIAESKAGDKSKIIMFGAHLDSVRAGPGFVSNNVG